MTSTAQQWALAVAAIPLERAEHLPMDPAACRLRLTKFSSIDSREKLFGFWKTRRDLDAYEMAYTIASAAWGVAAGFCDEPEAWARIFTTAQIARQKFASWRELGESYDQAIVEMSDGRGNATREVTALLDDPASPWRTIPWDTELGSSDEAPFPIRQRWARALAAPHVLAEGGDPEQLGGYPFDAVHPADVARRCATHLREHHRIETREQLIAWGRQALHGTTQRALTWSQLVAGFGWAVHAGIVTESDAWHAILLAAKLVQNAFPSWDAFADELRRDWRAHDRASELVAASQQRWSVLPWETDLEVTLLGDSSRARVLHIACATCGAPRQRPSPTAFVYCDHCGSLVDYDFARACEYPPQRPGPVYEALRAQLAPALERAHSDGNTAAYRDLQHQVFEAWVLACPNAVPIRVRDPAYRARFVAYLAEGETVAAFDTEAAALQHQMETAIAALAFADVDGRVRVLPEPYRRMLDAVFAYEARRDTLYLPQVYALHPDGASRELQRRIGHSMFAQGWLPYLAEEDARELLERTGLTQEYVLLDAPETRARDCDWCGGPLEILAGARRVVCDHCGRLVDVIAP